MQGEGKGRISLQPHLKCDKMNQSPILTTSHNGDMCSAVDASSPRPNVTYPLST